jgi:hypothetical protein
MRGAETHMNIAKISSTKLQTAVNRTIYKPFLSLGRCRRTSNAKVTGAGAPAEGTKSGTLLASG